MPDTASTRTRFPLLLARGSTALLALLAVAQATLAGNFLGGQYDALMWHAIGARAITIASAVQVAVLAWVWRAGGPRAPFFAGAVQTLLLVAEFATGELHYVAVHVPLGVLLVAGMVQLTAMVWRTPLPARPVVEEAAVAS
ncbi:hypothetical protein [Mycobacterium sp. E3198]|uniref:hypothetical protein n=1 Tax=Mycobacterium sp. E3198 TaxID=1834143 RepID=UPI000A7FC170|nr:hypothetical protein [Mycobacterium sp. E3198]